MNACQENQRSNWERLTSGSNWINYVYPGRTPAECDDEGVRQIAAIQEWITIKPGFTVIDYGCGTGRLSRALAPLVTRVIGLDISRPILNRLTSQDRIQYLAIDEFHEEKVADFVICLSCLQHNDDENRRLIADHVKRVLKPGGVFVANFPHAGGAYRKTGSVGTGQFFVCTFNRDEVAVIGEKFSSHKIHDGNLIAYNKKSAPPGQFNEYWLEAYA